MTDYEWSKVRSEAVQSFGGQTPGLDLENELLELFERRPRQVSDAIGSIASGFAAGRVRSPWGFLLAYLRRENEQRELVVTDGSERERAVLQAENWIRISGLHFDGDEELRDELFGDRGILRPWRHDTALRARMHSLWLEQHPRGEEVELEEGLRAEGWKGARGKEKIRPGSTHHPFGNLEFKR